MLCYTQDDTNTEGNITINVTRVYIYHNNLIKIKERLYIYIILNIDNKVLTLTISFNCIN